MQSAAASIPIIRYKPIINKASFVVNMSINAMTLNKRMPVPPMIFAVPISFPKTVLFSSATSALLNHTSGAIILFTPNTTIIAPKTAKRRKANEGKIASLTNYLNGYLTACYPNEEDRRKWKFKTPRVVLGYRKSTSVEVPNLEELDKEYLKIKTETSVDKVAIKDAIKSGKEHRKKYYGSKAIDGSCRNHGGCPWCEENRKYKNIKRLEKALDKLKEVRYN